jgi:glycosyltransferase involved in cell wall biosynthesis
MPTPWTSDWSVLIAKIKNKKSVISIKNDLKKYGFIDNIISTVYINTLFRLTLALVDKILVVNTDWKNVFLNTRHVLMKYQNKIEIIPNGIDLELFNSEEKNIGNYVLFVSILSSTHRFKGLDYLLRSISEVKTVIKDIKLIVVGEGELKHEYMELAKKLKIDSCVEFVGEKRHKELVSYYANANMLVLPSIDTEGFGNVLVEALSCKTPVITTNIVGFAEDIKLSNCGLIVKVKDTHALSKAIIKLMSDNELSKKMGENGRKLVENKYSWKKVSEDVKNIYLKIVR